MQPRNAAIRGTDPERSIGELLVRRRGDAMPQRMLRRLRSGADERGDVRIGTGGVELSRHHQGRGASQVRNGEHECGVVGPVEMRAKHLGFGLPVEEEHATFALWSSDLGEALASVMTPDRRAKAKAALVGFDRRIREVLTERRARPCEDLLSRLLAEAGAAGPAFDDTELVKLVINLIVGGHDTSRSVQTSAVAHLTANPRELERLRVDPDRAPAAAEEVLRFEPPVAVLGREPALTIETFKVRIKVG